MEFIESDENPLVKYYHNNWKMTEIQIGHFLKTNHGKVFQITGQISNITESLISLEIKTYNPRYNYLSDSIYDGKFANDTVFFSFDSNLVNKLLNFSKNQLVTCSGILDEIKGSCIYLKLIDIK